MTENNYTCKIPIMDSNFISILNSEWTSGEINFLLLHDNQAWSGKFQLKENEDISELLEQLSLSREAFVEESRTALTTHGGSENFAYTLGNNKFTWKKCVRKNVAIKFGSVDLLEIPVFEAFEKIIDKTLDSNVICIEKLQNSEKQRELLEKDNKSLTLKLNELIEKKNEMETTLYSQFLCVLNEKKRKMKELKRKICTTNIEDAMQSDSDHFDSDTEIDSEEEEDQAVSKMTSADSSLDMENEPIILPKRLKQKRQNENIASTSGLSSKVKKANTTLQAEKPPLKGGKGSRIPSKYSCVMGKMPKDQEMSKSSEASEDAFTFPKRLKRTGIDAKVVQPSSSKIKYESDDETDLEKFEKLETDSDKTPSELNSVESVSENIEGNLGDTGEGVKNKVVKKDICDESEEKNIKNHVNNHNSKGKVNENSELTNRTGYKGLSSTTLDLLNQLI